MPPRQKEQAPPAAILLAIMESPQRNSGETKKRIPLSLTGAILGVFVLVFPALAAISSRAAPNWWVGPAEEFQELLDGAQREGEVIVWGSGSAQGKAMRAAWPKQWRVKVNFLEVNHEELVARALTEARAGLHTVDVINPSLVGVHLLYQRAIVARFVPDNVRLLRDIPRVVRKIGGVPVGWNPRSGARGFTYNTDNVKEPPRDWIDLLSPRWRGRIAFDMDMRQVLPLACPEGEGVGWGLERVRGFLRQLAQQKPQYSNESRLMATWVASGKVDILAGGYLSHVLALRQKGAPVNAVLPKIIGESENFYAVPVKAPHPNAGRLLLYWLASPESLRSLWDIGFYGHFSIPSRYYGDPDPSYSFYYDLGKGKNMLEASTDCVQRAEKENWVGVFRKDIGFE